MVYGEFSEKLRSAIRTLLTEATPKMLVYRDETFGPVAALFRFNSEEEAIAVANNTKKVLA